jgi:cytochrome b561
MKGIPTMKTPERYNPAMVVLHWLTVLLLLGAGLLSEDEGGRAPINIHMILGAALLGVMVIRLILRFTFPRPPKAGTGSEFLDKLGELVHMGLYFFAFLILAFGGLIAVQRNLIGYLVGTGPVVRGEIGFLYGAGHQLGWIGVLVLLFLHVAGALYHQFIIKDNLLKRMWFAV